MPTTTLTGDMFLAVVSKSNLVDAERLKRAVEEFRAAGGNTDNALAVSEHLIARSLITKWQAEKLLQGKHKGYFLSKYKLLSLLGKGGMSSVFLAEHTLMKRRCAIKVLPHKRVSDSSYLARFHREAQAVASLDHPNIVRAYDVDHQVERDTDIHFLVMEYVEGQSLQELVARSGPCPLADAVNYVRQSAVGLSHAHKAGLVHRDIKPGNLLRDQNGVVKILDLGLARFFDNQGEEQALTIQHDEKVLGTADYLAPEQALDSHTVDARADIYSLGCTLYFLLTGHPPFTEGTLTQRLMAHQTKEPPPVEKDRPDVPPSLITIVRTMMAKKPDDRYATAEITAEVLRKWLGTSAPPEWKKAHRELFVVDVANRPAPVMAQVVTPTKPAVPTPPAKPPSSTKIAPPPSEPAPLPAKLMGSGSSNIFSLDSFTEPSPAKPADSEAASVFAGIGQSEAPPSTTKPAPPAKSAPKSAVPMERLKASPPAKGKSSVVKVSPAAPSTVVAKAAPPASEPAADFSFLSAPVVSEPSSSPGSGAFNFLDVTQSPAPETPSPPSNEVVEPEVAAVVPRAAEVGATSAEPEPAPPSPPIAKPVKTPVVAKVVPPKAEPEFSLGTPAEPVTPAGVTAFDFTASGAAPVVEAPAMPSVVEPTTAAFPAEEEPPGEETPVASKKAVRPAIALPPVLQDRRVQIGLAGGAGLVVLVLAAYGFGLFGSGNAKADVKKGSKKGTTPATAKTSSGATGGTAAKSSEWARKRIATVGHNEDFATLGDALQTVKLHFKQKVRSDRFTIKVAAGTYAERIVIDGKSWPSNITIIGEGGAFVLEPSGAEPAIKISNVEGVQISNVLVKAQGKPVAVELAGNLAQVRLQKFTLQGFGEAGIHLRGGLGLSFSDARCQIEEGQFESGANAVGIKCTPGDGADGLATQNVVFQKLRFLGPLAAGVTVSGKDSANLEFRESIFSDTKVGVRLLAKTGWRDFQFVNNTFYKVPSPILIAEQPEASSKGLSIRRNLFVDSGPEAAIEQPFDENQLLSLQMLGKNALNFSTRAKPDGVKNELPIFGDGGKAGDAALKFVSTDSKDSKFLVPAEGTPQRSVGGQQADEKPYVGAVGP